MYLRTCNFFLLLLQYLFHLSFDSIFRDDDELFFFLLWVKCNKKRSKNNNKNRTILPCLMHFFIFPFYMSTFHGIVIAIATAILTIYIFNVSLKFEQFMRCNATDTMNRRAKKKWKQHDECRKKNSEKHNSNYHTHLIERLISSAKFNTLTCTTSSFRFVILICLCLLLYSAHFI